MFRLFGLLLVGLVLAGCTTVDTTHSLGKDISITFPAWVSDEKKQQRLEAEAALMAMDICPGQNYELVDRVSRPWTAAGDGVSRIEANLRCLTDKASVSNDLKGYKFSNPNYPQSFAIVFPESKEIFLTSNNKWFKKIYEKVKNGRARNLFIHIGKQPTWNEGKPDSFGQIDSFRISNQKNIEGLLVELPKRSGGFDLGTGKWLRFCIEAGEWHCSATFNVESGINQESYEMLSQVIGGTSTTRIVSSTTTQSNTPSSAELETERAKRIELEQQIAALKAEQEQQQQTISSDTQIPTITATSRLDSQTNAVISGQVTDNVAVAEVTIDGEPVSLGSNGSFTTSFYVPRNGKAVEIVAFDKKGNKATKSLFIERGEVQAATGPVFASLNPSGKRVKANKDALALIVGIADYQRTPAKAAYADKDAQTFYAVSYTHLRAHET